MKLGSSKSVPRILCLEDNVADQKLLFETLIADGLGFELVHARGREEFEKALKQSSFDLIISDYSLPSYDGRSALAAAKAAHPETPFLFFSGTIGEERAVESLKAGATDYILKDRPDRLVSSVRRALRESHDRIQRISLEQQVRHAAKMEAVGRLAGGIAHDFNNLLAVIRGNVDLVLADRLALNEENRGFLKEVVTASERAAGLTRQLLAFGRKHSMQLEELDLNYAMRNVTKMLARVIGEDIKLRCNLPSEPLHVRADVGMMEQIVMNLAVNARDAMPSGGEMLISTEKFVADEVYCSSHPEARAGTFVCLKLSDTGVGIPPEILPNIFEPFFTTKPQGKGTGLGLSVVYGIVKQHEGWIEVSSAIGEGTHFRIFLPALHDAVIQAKPQQAESVVKGGHERILLVEDDLEVRKMTRKLLEAFGYQVTEAASGREALEIWPTQGEKIDLLVTDMVMPDGVTGKELAEILCKQRPQLKAVFVSGYSADTDFLRRHNSGFLKKPYQLSDLINEVRRCLDSN